MLLKKKKMSLEERKGLWGWAFISPWIIGFTLLFAVPLLQSLRYSFSKLTLSPTGINLEFLGIANYENALTNNVDFNKTLIEVVVNMVVNVPLIVIFSLFIATVLNQQFRGRMIARAIFFLPVILASGVISSIESGDFLQNAMMTGGEEDTGNLSALKSFELQRLLLEAGLNEFIVNYLTGAVNRIYEIVSASGVQIIIFLAGLQSISPQLYEVAKIEGATSYESFWKITLPMISPLILTNVIYSVIDSFTDNKMTTLLRAIAFENFDYGLSGAMSWIYFLVISVILLISAFFISKKVFYQ
ncbi:carbohydrate ABC transporter permease [Lederbergia citrea]|uniref:carbohydrate ABC transporter permease n=1 Tax=Lederbergia citrea TaxID=2833581 RepID=UPI001BCA1DC4|nr:sugar ABC transporter permease [Lederbergia citrea]MBS4178992.1 sugar ABC transporter permease [Lederbergia citrea]